MTIHIQNGQNGLRRTASSSGLRCPAHASLGSITWRNDSARTQAMVKWYPLRHPMVKPYPPRPLKLHESQSLLKSTTKTQIRAAVDIRSGSSPPQRSRETPPPHQLDSADTSAPTRAHARPCPRRRPSRRAEGSLASCRAEQPVRAPLQHAAAISAVAAAPAAVRKAARISGPSDNLRPIPRRRELPNDVGQGTL